MSGEFRSRRRRLRLFAAAMPAALLWGVAAGEEIVVSPNLANQLRFIEVGLASGRVTATPRFAGRSLNTSAQLQDRREQLTINLNGGAPVVDYELTTKTMRIVVDLDRGNALVIRRTPLEGSSVEPFEFNQPDDGKITVSVGDDPREKNYSVDSLWHLSVLDPDFVQNELEPLLRLLRPGWPFASECKQLEESLFKQIDAERSYDRRSWSELVAQLSDPHYSARREADRKLRELGHVVVPYLRSLDGRKLDAEQAYRVRTIVRSYGAESGFDTPETAADWLAADPEIWYSLAGRTMGSRRQQARTQLALLLGEPVVLEADATGEVLRRQLAEIRKQIERLQAK